MSTTHPRPGAARSTKTEGPMLSIDPSRIRSRKCRGWLSGDLGVLAPGQVRSTEGQEAEQGGTRGQGPTQRVLFVVRVGLSVPRVLSLCRRRQSHKPSYEVGSPGDRTDFLWREILRTDPGETQRVVVVEFGSALPRGFEEGFHGGAEGVGASASVGQTGGMSPGLEIVGVYATSVEAHVHRVALEQAGLLVVVEDDNAASGDGPGWPAGGVKLLVRQADAPRAREVLGE